MRYCWLVLIGVLLLAPSAWTVEGQVTLDAPATAKVGHALEVSVLLDVGDKNPMTIDIEIDFVQADLELPFSKADLSGAYTNDKIAVGQDIIDAGYDDDLTVAYGSGKSGTVSIKKGNAQAWTFGKSVIEICTISFVPKQAVTTTLSGDVRALIDNNLADIGADDQEVVEKAIKVEEEVGPTAAFTASVTTGTAPLAVQFTDQSTAGTSGITGWVWDFGDGGSSALQNPTYTYNAAGTYTVKLTVSTTVGSDWETKTAYISVQAAPGCLGGTLGKGAPARPLSSGHGGDVLLLGAVMSILLFAGSKIARRAASAA